MSGGKRGLAGIGGAVDGRGELSKSAMFIQKYLTKNEDSDGVKLADHDGKSGVQMNIEI
jgi:hypothetical protein